MGSTRKSNFDLLWTRDQQQQALAEGWEVARVVDEGKPVSAAYLDVFDCGPKFANKRAAMRHVIEQARGRSTLHIAALGACQASRIPPQPHERKKG